MTIFQIRLTSSTNGEDLAFSSPYCQPNFFTSLNDLHCTFQVHIWLSESTSYIRYHAIFLLSLYGEREKRSLEALLVSFPTVRDQKPTPGILVSVSKKKKRKKFTVLDCFVLQPREPAYFTYDSGMNSLKFKLWAARSEVKSTERFPSCAGGKRQQAPCVVQACKSFCCGISPLSSQAFHKKAKGLTENQQWEEGEDNWSR